MRRYYSVSDYISRLCHVIKRNRAAVIVYALLCAVFLVTGIAVGINVSDKSEYVARNGAVIFGFLRGDRGVVAFFFLDLVIIELYALFASSVFFTRPTTLLSVAPAFYKSYSLGLYTSVIICVYKASALPMLFVFFVPVSLLEVAALCVLSKKCFNFCALNNRCFPTKGDIISYYVCCRPVYIVLVLCVLLNTICLALFGSALIGIL